MLLSDSAAFPLWVRTDKTHCEHNESGYPSIADMRADIDWRRLVPQGEVAAHEH